MAVRKIDNQDFILASALFFNPLYGFFCPRLCHIFSLVIKCFQFCRHHICLCPVFLKQQVQRAFCSVQSSASVDARSQYKPDMVGFDLFFFQSAGTDQGCHPDILCMVQSL